MTRTTRRRGRRRRRRQQRMIAMLTLLVCFVLCVGIGVAAFKFVPVALARGKSVITIQAEPVELRQEQEIPETKVKVKLDGNEDVWLKWKPRYTVADLMDEIKKGECYEVINNADNMTEGEYPIEVVLNDEFREKIATEFEGLVEIQTPSGTCTVKNKYGDWEDKKFKLVDGNYVTNQFMEISGNKYFFNEKGERVTGELVQGNRKYTFDDKGILVSEELEGIDPSKPMIALTFDDGPGKDTGRLLDALEKYNARATFFMLGNSAKHYPEEIKRMKELNCELGNHSTTHPQLTKLSADGIKKEIETTTGIIEQAAGAKPTVMRPPYGAINDTVKSNVGLPMILWSIDTLDWKTKNVQSNIDSIMSAKDGDIILLHDIHTPSVDATIQAIPKLIEKGFQLVTVSELAEAKGNKLDLGVKYFSFE